ncbi:hypothetical protein [Mycobacterium lepromatosis]|uniref:hypothetical protein n=1 Tax=Mycobacterium lepromatosis TaxID=480418 RepID=UPI000B1A25E8|nr:hypothetical protein [Mycobacterium lepromatosis]
MLGSDTPEIVVGTSSGVATGYVLWLVAISIGDNITAVSLVEPDRVDPVDGVGTLFRNVPDGGCVKRRKHG